MKFTQISEDAFKELQLNAGILVSSFNTSTGAIGDILGATSGGVSFNAIQSFTDFADDIDNAPKNTKEFKKGGPWDVKLSGTYATVTTAAVKDLLGAADVESNIHVVPRQDLKDSDFKELWWVGDYGEDGFLAIKMDNTLSTGGFKLQTTDQQKGKFAFEFTAHYTIANQTKVPFEVYVSETGTNPQ